MSSEYALQLVDIEKSFNRTPVLRQANFELKKGEVHALVGGNGAGKSTLMKILTGVYAKDAGEIIVNGKSVHFEGPADSERNSIAMIFQEFSLVPTMTVAENIFLAREPKRRSGLVNHAECKRRAAEILKTLRVDIDPNSVVNSLSVGYWQMVEIAKAMSKNAQILIMDEPTASLSESETSALFELVRRLKENGISIVYISHRMAEIFQICDRVSVLKDGQTVLTDECKNVSLDLVIEKMLGGDAGKSFVWKERDYKRDVAPVLEVKNLSCKPRVNNVSFEVRPGEIIGIAGLMGSGRTEIVESIFGIRKPDSGEVYVNGTRVNSKSEAIRHGVAFVPEDRRKLGLILEHTVRDNMVLPLINHLTKGWFVNDDKARQLTEEYIGKLNIKTDGTEKIVRLLSGGNQQKIVLGKWLLREPKVLILDEPTIGVDIGAKSKIVEIIRSLAESGVGVVVISSEFEELLAVSDRLLILYGGTIKRTMDRREIQTEEDLQHAVQGY